MPLHSLTIHTSAGSDPDVAIDDASAAVGELCDYGDIAEPCISLANPRGYCEFTDKDNHTRCIHCGKESSF